MLLIKMFSVLRAREAQCKRKVGDYYSKPPGIFRALFPAVKGGEEVEAKRGHRKLPGVFRRAEHPRAKWPPASTLRAFNPHQNNGGVLDDSSHPRLAGHLRPEQRLGCDPTFWPFRPLGWECAPKPLCLAAAAGSALGQRRLSHAPILQMWNPSLIPTQSWW